MPVDETLRHRFEMAVDQLADSLFRVAFRLTGNQDLASELVQESYFHAWRSLGSLKDVQKLRSWMFAILHNQYTKQLRKESGWHPLPADVEKNLTAQGTENVDEVNVDVVRDMIQSAMNRLSDDHKLPILLVSMEGLSVNEASQVLDIPRGTVLSRLHRGREKLKQILNSELEPT